MKHLQIAKQAARAGGEVVARFFREGVAIRSKDQADSYNLVTDADIQSEQAIVAAIRDVFPDHAILAEEEHQADTTADHLWVIDPLDGTNNFAHKLPHFAVSIAYCEKGAPVCGVVYNPVRDDWYEAVVGEGAWCNGQRVHVGEQQALTEVLIATGFYYDRGEMMEATLTVMRDLFRRHVHGIRRFGTASLDLAMVGTGAFGAYFEYTLSPWDYAAGQLFVEQAGGRVTSCDGESLDLQRTGVLASNGKLHEPVLDVVRRYLPA